MSAPGDRRIVSVGVQTLVCVPARDNVVDWLNRPFRAEIDVVVYPGLPLRSARGYFESALPGLKQAIPAGLKNLGAARVFRQGSRGPEPCPEPCRLGRKIKAKD
jgi:hypothetical protein